METGYKITKTSVKNKKTQGCQFRPVLVALLAAALIAAVFYLSGVSGNHAGTVETASLSADTRTMIEQMEAKTPSDPDSFSKMEEETQQVMLTQEDISALQAELLEHYGDYDYNADRFRYWFEDAAIVGDSVAQAIGEFDWLYSQNLQTQIGISLLSCSEVIEGTIDLQPGTVFLVFSANNIALYGAGVEEYISDYTDIIQELKDNIPNADIYVEGILPCNPELREEYWYYDYLDDYNAAMQQMCEDLDVTYFDPGFVLRAYPDSYNEDGLHPSWHFYPLWLTYMARIAGLAD